MKIAQCILYLFFGVTFLLTACSTTQKVSDEPLAIKAVTSEISIVSSDKQVSDFLVKNKDFVSTYELDKCYCITPDFVAENSDFEIFKYNSSTASYLMYDKTIYETGGYFGGFGITSMALADLDEDNQYELYYTFSWGSGLHRSQIGYFNPATKGVTVFDYSYLNYDMILTANENGGLCVNQATVDGNSFVDFTVKAVELIGTIHFEDDKISLNMIEQN